MLLLFLLTSATLNIVAQPLPNEPLTIEDARTDAYLQKRKIPVLTIKVLNRPNDEKTEITCSMVTFGPNNQVKQFTQLNAEGNAVINLSQNLPYQQIWLTVGKYLYAGVYVNEDLTVTIDAARIKKGAYMIADGVQYSGTDGELNKVMNERVLFRKKEHDGLFSFINELSLKKANAALQQPPGKKEEAAFQKTVDSVQGKIDEINNAFLVKYPEYAWAVKNETASEFYDILCFAYASDILPQKYYQKIVEHKPFFTSNGGVYFYRALSHYVRYNKSHTKPDPFDAINKEYAKYGSEQKAVLDSVKIYERLAKGRNFSKTQELYDLYKKRNTLFFNELSVLRIKNDANYIDGIFSRPKSDIVKLFLMQDGKDVAGLAYPILINNTVTNWCRERIEEELSFSIARQKRMDSLLAAGKTISGSNQFIGTPLQSLPFGADLYKLDSIQSIDELIVNLKSRFNGKALIIDFWATWCAPCIADLPHSKALHDTNKDLPVEYIYLCTTSGSTEAIWKKRIIDAEMPGIHVFVEDKIIAGIKTRFNAGSGYPAYVVIDKNGKSSATAINWMGDLDREKLKSITGL